MAVIKVVLYVQDQRCVVPMGFLKLLMRGRTLAAPESFMRGLVDLGSVLSPSVHVDSGLFDQVMRLNACLQRVAPLHRRVDVIQEILDLGPAVLGTTAALHLKLI